MFREDRGDLSTFAVFFWVWKSVENSHACEQGSGWSVDLPKNDGLRRSAAGMKLRFFDHVQEPDTWYLELFSEPAAFDRGARQPTTAWCIEYYVPFAYAADKVWKCSAIGGPTIIFHKYLCICNWYLPLGNLSCWGTGQKSDVWILAIFSLWCGHFSDPKFSFFDRDRAKVL